MKNEITTSATLWCLVDIDTKEHKLKDIATLFLSAMNDWPTQNQTNIFSFIKELKSYFGEDLTIECLNAREFNGYNAWQIQTAAAIADLIDISTTFCNESNFDKIVINFLNYYNNEFKDVDFIAELEYFTTEKGGRKTPAISGYRPQVKFNFAEMQTSGKQTFIDKEIVFPGDKVSAKIKMLSPDYFLNCLIDDMEFEFREGARVIGTGKIKYIINDKLEKPQH